MNFWMFVHVLSGKLLISGPNEITYLIIESCVIVYGAMKDHRKEIRSHGHIVSFTRLDIQHK